MKSTIYAWRGSKVLAVVAVGVMCLSSCQSEKADEPVANEPEAVVKPEGYAVFASKSYDTRTSMDEYGSFYWSVGDNIFVDKGTEGFMQASQGITTASRDATFWIPGTFQAMSYPVRYTGKTNSDNSNGTNEIQVTIAANQTQSKANNSDHFATSGDCGVATATLVGDSYEFVLDHKASYLVLNPVTKTPPMVDYCYLLSVTVEDLSGGTLCGTYSFDENGLDVSSVSSSGKTITLDLQKERDAAQDYYSTDSRWKDVTGEIKDTEANFHLSRTSSNKAYIVMQPGTHELKVTYRVAYFRLQDTEYASSGSSDSWHFLFDDNVKDYSINYSLSDYQPGYFYTMRPELDLSPQEPVFQYNYSGYHQWDAQGSYWDFLTADPTTASGVSRTNNETQSYPFEDVRNSSSITPIEQDYYINAKSTLFTSTTPNANEMTWYIMEGDVHRDMETLWWMHGYHNQYTLCKGGVWMKKKDKISGFTTDNTYNAGDGNLNLTLDQDRPDDAKLDKFKKEFDIDENHKHRPDDVAISDYFFLPDRGYYMTAYDSVNNKFKLQLKLLGAEGFYWTSTAIKNYTQDGKTRRHAYALEINNRNTNPFVRLKYKDEDWELVMRRWGFIAGYRPYTDNEPWFQ